MLFGPREQGRSARGVTQLLEGLQRAGRQWLRSERPLRLVFLMLQCAGPWPVRAEVPTPATPSVRPGASAESPRSALLVRRPLASRTLLCVAGVLASGLCTPCRIPGSGLRFLFRLCLGSHRLRLHLREGLKFCVLFALELPASGLRGLEDRAGAGEGEPKKRSRSRSCGYGCSEATGEGTKPGPLAGWPPPPLPKMPQAARTSPLFSSFHAATVEGQQDTLHARPAINLPHPETSLILASRYAR